MKCMLILMGVMILTAVPLAWCLAASAETKLYVAVSGHDAWSGRLPAPNAAATDGPFRSLERAREEVLRIKRAGPLTAPVTVRVRDGTYLFDQTLVFTPEHSGTEQYPVTFRAYEGEKPVLSGATPVRGWRQREGGLVTASLPKQGVEHYQFHQIFCRGERQILARHPNFDPQRPCTGGHLYVAREGEPNLLVFYYAPGEIPCEQWGDLSQAEINIVPYNCWDHAIIPVAQIHPNLSYIRLQLAIASIREGNRYFIQNVRGALDAPGEWWVDQSSGTLWFMPPGGAVQDGEVLVPVVENLVLLSGTPDEPVHHLVFHGFTLGYAEQDAIVLEGARDCQISGNTISNIGGIGINLGYVRNRLAGIGNRWVQPGRAEIPLQSGDRALQHSHPVASCRVVGNDIHATGGDGIMLAGALNVADNNHIYHTGQFDGVSAAVTVCGGQNVVSHNALHDVPRDAIFINGGRNTVEYNSIRHAMLNSADGAGISLRQHDRAAALRDEGNVLRFNRILDTIGYGTYPHTRHPPKGYASPYCSFGIYLDGFICGTTITGNVIARCATTALHLQYGGSNLIENNILVETDAQKAHEDYMVVFGNFGHQDPDGQHLQPPNQVRHNILYYRGPQTRLYAGSSPTWNQKQAVFERNIVWNDGHLPEVMLDQKLWRMPFDQWQAMGFDSGSVVADPLFVDPEKDDFRLQANSPALAAGFRNLNEELERIGAYDSPERASWPLQQVMLEREEPMVFEYKPRPAQ